MKTFEFTTKKGSFILLDLVKIPLKEFTIENKTYVPIKFLKDLKDKDCENIVDNYGPFGEYKGGKHPSGGAMKFRAYGSALSALKCVLEDNNIDFKKGFLMKINKLKTKTN